MGQYEKKSNCKEQWEKIQIANKQMDKNKWD